MTHISIIDTSIYICIIYIFYDLQCVREILDAETSSLLEDKSSALYEKSSRGQEDVKSSFVKERIVRDGVKTSHVDRIEDDAVEASR